MAKKRKATKQPKPTGKQPIPPEGFKLRRAIRDDEGEAFTTIAWSPDGQTLAAGHAGGGLSLWDARSGRLRHKVESPVVDGFVSCVAWSPEGDTVAYGYSSGRVALLDVERGRLGEASFLGQDPASDTGQPKPVAQAVHGVAWSPDGRRLAVASDNSDVLLFDVKTGQPSGTLVGHEALVVTVTWLPRDGVLASVSADVTIGLWDVAEGRLLSRWPGHEGPAVTVACSPDGKTLVSGGWDGTVRVWERETGREIAVLEDVLSEVYCVSVSADGRLIAAMGSAGEVLTWRLDTLQPVGPVCPPSEGTRWFATLAFHPTEPVLAAIQQGRQEIGIWDIDMATVTGRRPPADSVRYANAKIVVMGDSGVGKTGLSTVMAGGQFAASESTHGRRVLTLQKETVDDKGGPLHRETFLWDLAGQPGYRLVHQLSIDYAAVALVLFDARSETDPFGAAAYWSQAIDQAAGARPITKLLVAARADRGGVGVSQRRIDRFVAKHGFAGFHRTSAKTGEGVKQLAAAARAAVDWHQLPVISSNRFIGEVRDYVRNRRRRTGSPLLCTMAELHRAYCKARRVKPSAEDFERCVRRLGQADVVDVLVFTMLDEEAEPEDWVLLDPAYVDAYASAVVIAARDEPDGIGHLKQTDVLEGRFELDATERLPEEDAQRKVLVATVERLLEHDIALEERIDGEDFLVFPSQYTRDAPFPGSSSYGLCYDFAGPVRSVFTTLVVRLAHNRRFVDRDFYRDAACYESVEQGKCIVLFSDLDDGRGRMTVFFEDEPPAPVQRAFLQYVYEHLLRKATPGSIVRSRAYHCPNCTYLMDDAVVEQRLSDGKRDIVCPSCDTRSPLYELIIDEQDEPTREAVRQIDTDAREAKDRELASTAIRGKRETGEYDVFIAYHSADRETILRIGESLKAVGLRPWIDVWSLVPGLPWMTELEKAMKRIDAAAICVGPSGIGPWEDLELQAWLKRFVKHDVRVMPVLLPGIADEPELSPLLEAFTGVDLRRWTAEKPEPFRHLVAGVVGRPPDELLSRRVDAALLLEFRAEKERAQRKVDPPLKLTVALKHKDDALEPLDVEAVRAQLAETLNIPSSAVRLAADDRAKVPVNMEFDDADDLLHFFVMLAGGQRELLKRVRAWQADPARLLADNRAAERQVRPKGSTR